MPAVPPPAKIRVANFFLVGGSTPGPALDFYDTQQPGNSDKPLISNLAWGKISAYVSPRADAGYSNLYIYPAGSKTWGKPFDGTRTGTNSSSSGWVAGQQETVVMGTDLSTRQPTFATVAEVEPKSADLESALLRPVAGKGLLAVNVSGLIEGTRKWPNVDLRIDGVCPDNVETNGKPAQHSNASPVRQWQSCCLSRVLLRVDSFTAREHCDELRDPFGSRLRLFGSLDSVENRVAVLGAEVPEHRGRFRVVSQRLSKVVRDTNLGLPLIRGLPAPLSPRPLDRFNPGGAHSTLLEQAIDDLNVSP